MADDPQANGDNAASNDAPKTLEEATAKISELTKALEQTSQEVSVMKGRVRSTSVTSGAVDELGARVQESMQEGMKILLETDDPDERRERYANWVRENDRAANRAKAITKHQSTLMKLVDDNGIDFQNDETFAEVREAWNGPNPETAIPLARLAVKAQSSDGYSREQVQEEIQAALRNANLSNGSVDTSGGGGEETVGGPAPTSFTGLAERAREARQSGKPMSIQDIKEQARALRRTN